MEARPQWRRLALLGIEGNQPAISAFCKTTKEEDDKIAEAVVKQKVGANPKTVRTHTDATRSRNEEAEGQRNEPKTLYHKAHIACGAAVRWKRSITEHASSEEGKQDDSQDQDCRPTYLSRLLSCVRCCHPNETSWMQLRSQKGFRAIHCRGCGFQQLAGRNKCQCGTIWHHCPIHRIDPVKHLSKKAPKKSKEEQEAGRRERDRVEAEGGGSRKFCKRKAAPPVVEEGVEAIRNRRGTKARTTSTRIFTLKPMRSIAPLLRCDPARLERIRARQRANKEIEMRMKGSSSSSVQREESKFVPVDAVNGLPSNFVAPELDDGFTELEWPELSEKVTSRHPIEPRANEDHIDKKHFDRKAFDTQLQQDILHQASRATKRMRTADMKPRPMHANMNLEHADREHQIRLAGEFKSARQKVEDGAILRLITKGKLNEPPAGKPQSDK